MKKSINVLVDADYELNKFILDNDDWLILEKILKIKRPFKMATLDLSSDKRIMSSSLRIITTKIIQHIDSCLRDSTYEDFLML
jgi:hypothetical protein